MPRLVGNYSFNLSVIYTYMRSKIIIFLFIFTLTPVARAQDLVQCMGRSLNSLEVTYLINQLDREQMTETIMPLSKVYQLDFPADGITLEFDDRFALAQITLYDSGYTYKAYELPMPHRLSWGNSTADIEELTSFIETVPDNPFKGIQQYENYELEYYFTNAKLSSLRLKATPQVLTKHHNDVMRSYGIRLYPDGRLIEGNALDGTATMAWGDGFAVYKGEWSYGVPHGKGKYTDSLGNSYSGEFKLGFFWGLGDFYSKSEQLSYSGQFVMGKRHGKGKSSYPTKVGYLGDWFQDVMNGKGTYIMGNGYLYEGDMLMNNITGKGKLQTPDGMIEGTFKNGRPHGICVQTSLDGTQRLEGRYVNGVRQGKFVLKNPSGEREINYVDGIEMQ